MMRDQRIFFHKKKKYYHDDSDDFNELTDSLTDDGEEDFAQNWIGEEDDDYKPTKQGKRKEARVPRKKIQRHSSEDDIDDDDDDEEVDRLDEDDYAPSKKMKKR